MKFAKKLKKGRLLKRYKRFFADIEVSAGKVEVAHVANTGSLKGIFEGTPEALYSQSDDPERKLKLSLEAIRSPFDSWVGVNTSMPNKLVKEAIEEKIIESSRDFIRSRGEFAVTKETRFDFAAYVPKIKKALKDKSGDEYNYFIEVKNVTMANDQQVALFPDSVTERGQKHLRELMRLVEEGFQCELVFVIQRDDCKAFSAAKEIDPEYAKLLVQAQKKGVKITPLMFAVDSEEVKFVKKLEFVI